MVGSVPCAAKLKLRWLGAGKDTSVQGLEGGVQLCTPMDLKKTRECTCVCGSIVRQCFVCQLGPQTQSEWPISRPKVRLGMSR